MKVLILGIGGQDGSYLAEQLLEVGVTVHGLYRRSSVDNLQRIAHIRDQVQLHPGDLTDSASLRRVLETARPDEIYNAADQDHVGFSFTTPEQSLDVTANGVVRLLEAVRQFVPTARVFQPISATMFGDALPLQNEQTLLNPQSPYACAKAAAYHLARYYRQVHGMFVSTAILYNHDSPRRGGGYLLQKIARGVVQVARGKSEALQLDGDLSLHVDIGYAGDFMRAIPQILRLSQPDDFVIGTGTSYTIRELVTAACHAAGVPDEVQGKPSFDRPGPQSTLVSDIRKAQTTFGFKPGLTGQELVAMLVRHHLEQL